MYGEMISIRYELGEFGDVVNREVLDSSLDSSFHSRLSTYGIAENYGRLANALNGELAELELRRDFKASSNACQAAEQRRVRITLNSEEDFYAGKGTPELRVLIYGHGWIDSQIWSSDLESTIGRGSDVRFACPHNYLLASVL